MTLVTSDGDWPFELEWTGDDNYLFLATATRDLFAGDLKPLLTASPRNVHYFFGWLTDQLSFEQVRARWSNEIQLLPAADRDHWLTHVHFVLPRLTQDSGWIGTMLTARAAMPPMYLGNGLRAPAQGEHPFPTKPNGDSGACRTPIPGQGEHRFRSMPNAERMSSIG